VTGITETYNGQTKKSYLAGKYGKKRQVLRNTQRTLLCGKIDSIQV